MVTELNTQSFETEILSKPGVAVVDFYATWCGPCKALLPKFESLSEEFPNVRFFKINIGEELELAKAIGVMAVPSMALYTDGKFTKMVSGQKIDTLKGWLMDDNIV